MAKLHIELDEIDVEATFDKAAEVVKHDMPHVKKGLQSVESDVVKTCKAIYNWLAENEELQRDE